MLVSPKKRKTRLDALLNWMGIGKRSDSAQIFSEDRFRNEMQKEKSRIDRRAVQCEFSLILVNGLTAATLSKNSELLVRFQKRMRITDCLGWCESKFGILLPETGRQGSEVLAADFCELAAEYGLKVETDILVYPDDDDVVRGSIEFQDFQFSNADHDIESGGESENDADSASRSDLAMQTVSDELRESVFRTTCPTPLWKRAVDVLGSSIGLVLLSPVFAVAAIAVKISAPGPVFFSQTREGKDGKPFKIFKFRTMCVDAELMKQSLQKLSEQDGPAFKLENDPRLTGVGKYLRKSCVDELPQLINVLKGDMSLVGPRPLPVSESVECLMWQRKRLEVVPGLTCIWQVAGDRQTKFADWMRMDLQYIQERSLWLDLKLIFQTIWVAVLHRGSV